MKNLYFYLLLMISLMMPLIFQAQNFRYIDPDNSWYGDGWSVFSPPFSFSIHISRDSFLRNNHYYHKMIGNGSNNPLGGLIGYYRQEGKKVYKYINQDEEQLLYDFGWEKGDTIRSFVFDNQRGYFLVDSISISNIPQTEGRKIWYISSHCNNSLREKYEIIEGIGSIRIEFKIMPCIVLESNSTVRCVYNKDNYTFKSGLDCDHNKHLSLLNNQKQWIAYYRDSLTNTNMYERYRFKKVLSGPTLEYELEMTTERISNTNWKSTGKFFTENDRKVQVKEGLNSYILFDYNLKMGDTFELAIPNRIAERLVVRNVDYIQLKDQRDYKVISLSSTNSSTIIYEWVEGMGDIKSFMFYYDHTSDSFSSRHQLRCYYYNYALFYTTNQGNSCDLLSQVENQGNVESPSITIYPNPTTDMFTIESSNFPLESVIVIDHMGIKIREFKISDPTNKRFAVDVSTWASGIYFLMCTDINNHRVTTKVVIP